ncbi:MAG: hypothetical protein AAGA54_33675 [Myxococcota bacterium]
MRVTVTGLGVALFVCAFGCGDDSGGGAASTTGEASTSEPTSSSTSAGVSTEPAPTTSTTTPASSSGLLDESSDDDGGLGEGAMCDLYTQDCQEGFKCSPSLNPVGDPSGTCVAVQGTAAPGDPCTHDGVTAGTDSCDARGLCFGELSFVDGWEGTCRAFCTGSQDAATCENPDEQCAGGLFPNCLPRCDPRLQDCEGPSEGCYFRGAVDSFVCLTSMNAAAAGEPCETGTSCNPGTQCREAAVVAGCSGGSCCTEYCDTEEAGACAGAVGGDTCIAIGAFEPEFQTVGVCGIPQ